MARGIQGAPARAAAARRGRGCSRLAVGAPGRRVRRRRARGAHARLAIAGAARPARQRDEDHARRGAGGARRRRVAGRRRRPTRRTDCAIDGRPSLARHPWLADGRLEVQDEGSQLDRPARRAATQRHGRRFLRRRRRQDAAARRDDALAGSPVRVRHVGEAPAAADAAARALGIVERASAGDRERARHEGEAPRRQDRSRAGRRARAPGSARCGATPTSSGASRRRTSPN